MSGWIKLHRRLLDWEWYSDINTSRLFIHLLLSSNHDQNRWQGKDINRGEVITGLFNLSKETGLTISQVRTALNKLKMTGEIAIKPFNKFSIISITNYNDYQSGDKQNNKQTTNKSQTNDKQIATNKNDKNDKNDKNIINTISLPDWLSVNDWNDYCNYRGSNFTMKAKELAIKKLSSWKEDGYNPSEILQNSIMNGWKGLYQPKEGKNANNSQNTRSSSNGITTIAREQTGNGYGGRKSQTELYAEATERIIQKRNAEWAAREEAERLQAIAKPIDDFA